MSEPISGMAAPSRTGAHVRAEEVLAATHPPSQTDLVELQAVASNSDRLLSAAAVDIDDLIYEFQQARNPLRHVKS